MNSIHEKIYDQVCSLLNADTIATLRSLLHSAMDDHDLASFCTDRDKLSMINYHRAAGGRGNVREFRSTVFYVRLLVTVETDVADKEVRDVQIKAEIQDGGRSGERLLVPTTSSNCTQ